MYAYDARITHVTIAHYAQRDACMSRAYTRATRGCITHTRETPRRGIR